MNGALHRMFSGDNGGTTGYQEPEPAKSTPAPSPTPSPSPQPSPKPFHAALAA